MKPKTNEIAFNSCLAEVLRDHHPRWRENLNGRSGIGAEQSSVFKKNARAQPDIVIKHAGGNPVVVETEFAPASTVEKDALNRMGQEISGRLVEATLAVRIPARLREVSQNNLNKEIRGANFDYCLFSGTSEQYERWPLWVVKWKY